jgi:hypothetical protein
LNHLVQREQLRAKTMELARLIAGNNRESVLGGATGTGAASRSRTAFVRRIASWACRTQRSISVKSNSLRSTGERECRSARSGVPPTALEFLSDAVDPAAPHGLREPLFQCV